MVCPVCEKDDAIQKVSAVVSSGQSSGTFSGPSGGVANVNGKWGTVSGYSTLSGTAVSEIARLLAPPQEPKKPSGYGCLWLIFGYIVLATASMVAIMPIQATTVLVERFPGALTELIQIVVGIISVIIGLGIAIILFYFIGRQEKRDIQRKKSIYSQEQKPGYDAAIEKWNRAYYCFRDDVVFDPESRQHCRPQELQQFLHS